MFQNTDYHRFGNKKLKLLQGVRILLKQLIKLLDNQPYLTLLYQCMFLLAYYGLLQIGEMATGDHPVRGKDVHCGTNKKKILLILFSSKTHGLNNRAQEIKIWSDSLDEEDDG